MQDYMKRLTTVLEFVKRNQAIGISSTGATVVDYKPGLYNVSGSTDDAKEVPGHRGSPWRTLLIKHGISATSECYVTEPVLDGGSHPKFVVGGHMTPNKDGTVANGICYLMPLCGGHDSTSKNGILFKHTESKMLKLIGYIQGELAATFQLRMPSAEPYALLYYTEGHWDYKNLSESQAANLGSSRLAKPMDLHSENYVLFKRDDAEEPLHYITAAKLPGVAFG